MKIKGRMVWTNEGEFIAEDEFGHSFVLEAVPPEGKPLSGFKPVSLLLYSLAGCMGYDIVSILKKKRADLAGFTVEITGEQSDEHPRRFTRIRCEFKAEGDVKLADMKRSLELSTDKYCSVLATLKQTPEFDFKLTILPKEAINTT
ncbi:MAG: OsmC family protein [bacterium]